LYWDIDGSLTGHIGGWVTPSSELHPPQYCNQSVMPFSVGSFPGSVCTSDVYFLRLAWNQVQPLVSSNYCGSVGMNHVASYRALLKMSGLTLPMSLD